MSSFCKLRKIKLGRTKRMLALQAPEKLAHTIEFEQFSKSERSLFYRALLSVIMKEELLIDSEKHDFKVGKTFSKSKNFVDYVRKCFEKLSIDADELKDETILSYFQKYQSRMKELVAFAAVRQIYAPVIECLILLDRFCYLLESAGESNITKCFLTELFDPVLSPRRFGLIAVK